MTDGRVTDPKALRALSHPFRWKLLNLLVEEGQLTATQCAAKLGESVASCSYHLNMLAKYGFVAEVEGPGRQKPWRLAVKRQQITSEGLDEEGSMAAEAATLAYLDNEYERMRERMRQHDLLPEQWRVPETGIGFGTSTKFLTSEEMTEVYRELNELFARFDERYQERVDNKELRPEGSRPVRFFMAITTAPD